MDHGSHAHCESCFSTSCSFTQCPVITCRLGCRARFHTCKQEDHEEEICSHKMVQCINSLYGCKDVFERAKMASHLAVCPASIVICTHTWNRWPLSFRTYNQQQYFREGQLDYEMVLRDQRMEKQLAMVPRKVKIQLRNFLTKRFPEVPVPECAFTKRDPNDRNAPEKEYAVDGAGNVILDSVMKKYLKQQSLQEKAWKRDLDARLSENILNICTEATKLQREGIHNHCRACVITECTIGKAFDPERWRESCPMMECRWGCGAKYHKCKTEDHSFLCKLFKEPDEMDWLRRLQISDGNEREENIDTVVKAEEPARIDLNIMTANKDEVPVLPHIFSEPTYLDVNMETIHKMHVKPVQIRSFICGKVFRRDEIADHLVNVHQEIIPGLSSGWFLSRCPLAYSGCSYATVNMAPNSSNFSLRFSRADDNFCCRLKEDNATHHKTQKQSILKKKSCKGYHPTDLSLLPVEIIFHVTSWLDSISLRNLSLTCKRIRDICFSLVMTRGCVTPMWERQKARGHRRERKVWEISRQRRFFSSAMAPVHSWVGVNGAAIQKHLETCTFNQKTSPLNPGVNKPFTDELKARVELKRKSDWYIV